MNSQKKTTATADLKTFLMLANVIIRSQGFVSGQRAKAEGIDSTGKIAWEWVQNGRPKSMMSVMISSLDGKIAEQTVEWMKSIQDGGNDYMTHLKGIGIAGVISEREIGYAASAIQAMQKEQKISTQNFVGEIGKKYSDLVKFVDVIGVDTSWGFSHKYLFEDASGNKLIWWTAEGNHCEKIGAEKGSTVCLSGTVKRHDTFGGSKSTVLTRAKVARV